jgi:hypothetical protein
VNEAKNVTADVDTVANDLYSFTKPMGDYAGSITSGLYIVYAIALFFSCIIFFSILIVLLCNKYGFRRLIHCGWCVYSIIMTLGFLLGSILNPASVISLQFCEYLHDFIHVEKFFDTSKLVDPGQTRDIMKECFFG